MAFSGSSSSSPRGTSLERYLPDWEEYVKDKGLTEDQLRFGRTFFTQGNVMLSGAAGTGKSFALKMLFQFLLSKGISYGKTATTGVSALNIGGQTIHSFAGLRLADEPIADLINTVRKNKKAVARIKGIQILFIDEVSMAKGDLLNKLDMVLKYFRYNNDPFGGCKVCMCADFLQLLPVFKGSEPRELAFQCRAWKEANIVPVVMKKVVRQQNDNVLLGVLNDVRIGNASSLHKLNSRIGATWEDKEIRPTRLMCLNAEVDGYNDEQMRKLNTQHRVYHASDTGSPQHIEALEKHCPVPKALHLKVGAQVVLLFNLDVQNGGLCNGSVGVVKALGPETVTVKFTSCTRVIEYKEWEIKEQEVGVDGKMKSRIMATRSQIPLKVAFAITAHRAQGLTLDRAELDMTGAFTANQVYCALSRVRDMESLSLTEAISPDLVYANEECVEFYRQLESASDPAAS